MFRVDNDKPIFLLLGFKKRNIWCLPKGIIEEGESDFEAAEREVKEETGLKNLNLLNKIGDIHYNFWSEGRNFDKTVHFYLFETRQKETMVGDEHDLYAWYSFERALDMLTYRNEKEIIKKGCEIAKKYMRNSET